jgi:hypothetical protein
MPAPAGFFLAALGSCQGVKGRQENYLLVGWQVVTVEGLPQIAREIALDVIAHSGLITSALKIDLE